MPIVPGLQPGQRFRCAACGNLTRFDIETVERVRRYWHADLSGEGTAEESHQIAVELVSVTCRWCASSEAIQVESVPAEGELRDDEPGPGAEVGPPPDDEVATGGDDQDVEGDGDDRATE